MNIPAQLQNEVEHLLQIIAEALLCQNSALRDNLIGKIEIHTFAASIKFVTQGAPA